MVGFGDNGCRTSAHKRIKDNAAFGTASKGARLDQVWRECGEVRFPEWFGCNSPDGSAVAVARLAPLSLFSIFPLRIAAPIVGARYFVWMEIIAGLVRFNR